MKLADLESREVLLAKLAGAMKGSLAKAARTFDALRIKMEAVSGPIADNAKSEVPAQVETADAVVEAEAPVVEAEAPVAEAVVTEEVVAEVAAEATDAAETPAE
jgi:large subunit ribosomal protein L10